MKKIIIALGGIFALVVLLGMFKFNILQDDIYDQDGNRILKNKKVEAVITKQSITSISPREFQALTETDEYTIIDVRTPEELLPGNGGKLFEEAINIDFYEPDFATNIEALDHDKKYLIYCRSGNRTGKTLAMMKELGFIDVKDLAGGRKAWLKTYPPNPVTEEIVEETVFCAEDAKICSDGTAVSREGPNCEFPACS
jgi:rhodanese-related sulfurtransferase